MLLQEAAVKEEGPPPAERNPAAVKYTGNLVCCSLQQHSAVEIPCPCSDVTFCTEACALRDLTELLKSSLQT